MKQLLLLVLIFFTAGCAASSPPLEEKELTFIVPGSPNGGWDALAKSIKTVIEREQLIKQPIHIVYEEGDGGNDGWARLNEEDSSTIAINSSLLLTNNLLGHSNLQYEDFTPLATMASEWQAVIVSSDSSIQSINDLMDKLKTEPGRYPIGIEPQFGNDDQIAFAQAARTKSISAASLRFFRYPDGKALLKALQNGKIAAASLSSSQSEDFAANGNVRIIAISSPKRLGHLPDVPTWKEQGINVVFPHWRGVMGPGDLTEAERKWWGELLNAVQSSPYWKEELKKNHWTHFYRNSEDTEALLRSDTKKYRYIMNQK
ncbi:tripartite tricarboxylate transporter substrate binding protein [Domibacillus sp. PGB-M46]|uniref:tripartite tricarboxylate transporter substrate-binding protein n=1 Tax=Domibacillus sp. PGB-M46 TaxID=2910255 RepID=UPI001F581E6D|nr:tripartite tricarboxylate transporter substrate-binding protein [Domibacillus sp. PGB-M46]MCI2253969.1 tripartite tricarboxylate transporter substrate binding protein [Domibacillus sp. PGB-M46]